jgi:GTP-binding protein LepA
MDQDKIRNFSIIAHIDHGKSTLADRILQLTDTVADRDMKEQLLDSMELERERGITIKAQAVRVSYRAGDGETYHLHLIDTPGHVDFSYEVSRSLAACEGALLVVDAAQGVEAQTVANTYAAVEAGLELIPVLNKVDLPSAEPERVAAEVTDLVGGDPEEVLRISAKTGEGVEEVLEAIVARIPPPRGEVDAPPRALIFDSEFDSYRGVIAYVRVVDGAFHKGERITGMQTGTEAEIDEIGFFVPQMRPTQGMSAGEVGYVITGIKDVARLRVGDTLTSGREAAAEPLPGYREVKPMVFCGLYPLDTDRYEDLRDSLDRLALNDAALGYEPETSQALGFGFRCGFLGLLHMDIVRERLEREYGLELLATTPNVRYEVELRGDERAEVRSPAEMPDPAAIEQVLEPYIRASVIAPAGYVGAVMDLCQGRRGTHVDMHYLSPERVQLRYDLPLAEIVLDFYDQLKSRTAGYASLDYEPIGNRASDLVKLDVLLAGERVDALSVIVHSDDAYRAGKALVERLQRTIPRQLFDVPVQAAIGSRVLARETVKALRKDVTAKLYGGDVTRKRKLLEKQKAGKKRMKQVGRVEVPQEAFLSVLEVDER